MLLLRDPVVPVRDAAPRLPHVIYGEFPLATQIERAAGEEAGGAFDVVAGDAVASAERAFPMRVVGAEKRQAGCSGEGGEVGQ